jgi:uncharacterized protein (UPF0335 family)
MEQSQGGQAVSKYMNPIKSVSINFSDEPLLTIHCDGRVTTSDRLKPTETAVLALDQIKTQWMKDAQATKIRELQDQIERLEDWKQSALAVEREWNANAIATMLGGQLGESQRTVIQREVPKLLERIKRLEEAGDVLAQRADQLGLWPMAIEGWTKAKEAKP